MLDVRQYRANTSTIRPFGTRAGPKCDDVENAMQSVWGGETSS
jgi:hypothetical protein